MSTFAAQAGLRRSLRNMNTQMAQHEAMNSVLEVDPTLVSSTLPTVQSGIAPVADDGTDTTGPMSISSPSDEVLSEIDSEEESQLRTFFEQSLATQAASSSIKPNNPSPGKRSVKPPLRFGEDVAASAAFFAEEDAGDDAKGDTDMEQEGGPRLETPEESTIVVGHPYKAPRKAPARRTTHTTTTMPAERVLKGRVEKPPMSPAPKTPVRPSPQLVGLPSPTSLNPTPMHMVENVIPVPFSPSPPTSADRLKDDDQDAFTPSTPAPIDLLEGVDPATIVLSEHLLYRPPISEKPAPRGEPPVWADSRQSLCETVNYFKKPQGGVHANAGHVYAFLYDGASGCREYMDSNIIIARAGGCMEPGDDEGTMIQTKDHTMTSSEVRAVINDIELQNPTVIIVGDNNAGSQCRLPHKYCVLDWFKIVDIWEERIPSKGGRTVVGIKYRFERLAATEPAWHAPLHDNANDVLSSYNAPLHSATCRACGKEWHQKYLEGWICFNSACPEFWKIGHVEAPIEGLHYDPAYLAHRTYWPREMAPYRLRRPLPDVGKAMGDYLAYIHTRGIICPQCGRCNRRYLFRGWVCSNPTCTWPGYYPQLQPVVQQNLHSPYDVIGDGPSLLRNGHAPGTKVELMYISGYKVVKYSWPEIDGCLLHASSNEEINREPGGADDMFAALQIEDLGLRRRAFAVEKHSGGQSQVKTQGQGAAENENTTEDTNDLMGSFSMNFGMPYKFVASGGSKSFDEAPRAILEARSRMNWAANTFLGPPPAAPESSLTTSLHLPVTEPFIPPMIQTIPVATNLHTSIPPTDIPPTSLQYITEPTDEAMPDTPRTQPADPIGVSSPPPLKTDFNEMLVLAYLESQKISYHDDGEHGLGPRIATLSLGGKATMSLRLKAKHWHGYSKTGLLTPEKPVPLGAGDYETHLAAWNEVQSLAGDRAAQTKRSKELAAQIKRSQKAAMFAPPLVSVTLGHGDLVLMDGYDVQKYLEHAVTPIGNLRFALTCRDVLEGHLKEHEKPSYTVGPDLIGYTGPVGAAGGTERMEL